MSLVQGVRGPIAIDGPVASGKSTVGKALAARLGWPFVDTGLMYRAVGYLALERGCPLDDATALVRLTREAAMTLSGASVNAFGREIGGGLHSPLVAEAASRVAQAPALRAALVERQRQIAQGEMVVMVGRDIGTVVLPDAPVKVYLEASPAERARRRQRDLQGSEFEAVLGDVTERDRRDQERAASPLKPAADAVILNTEGLSIDEVVDKILQIAKERR